MVEIKYKELFNLEILHSFYSSGKCPDFDVIPTTDCEMLMKRFGLHFILTQYGIKLFTKVKTVEGKDIAKNPVAQGSVFSFKLRLKNNLFENFTTINPARARFSHFYFNNLGENISESGLPLLVADTVTKVASDADLIPFVSGSFSFNHTAAPDIQESNLVFTDNGQSFKQQLENENNIFNFSYDLGKMPSGRAKFLVEEVEKSSFYVIKPVDYADTFGIVDIFFRNDLPATYQFQNADNSVETRSYKVAFASRATTWRYIVTRKFNKSISSLTIAKTNGNSLAFTTTNPAENQFVITSNTPIRLTESPVTGIKMSDQTNNPIITHLANPNLNLINVEGDKTFSDVLVTI